MACLISSASNDWRAGILLIETFSAASGQGTPWPNAKAAHDELRQAADLYNEFHEAWPGGTQEAWCHGYKAGSFAGAAAHLVLDGSTLQLAQVLLRMEAATQVHLVKKDLHVIQSVISPRGGAEGEMRPLLLLVLAQQRLELKGASASPLQDALDLLSNRDPQRRVPVKLPVSDVALSWQSSLLREVEQPHDLRSSTSSRGTRRSSRVVPELL
jgi:hypothetical protein